MKEKEKSPVLETTDQTIKNCEQALRAGMRMQEQAWQAWCAMMNQPALGSDWQKRFNGFSAAANELIPEGHKRLEEGLEVMEKNVRLSGELMKKAVDASLTPSVAESQSKWTEFVKSALEAGQLNIEAIMRINSRAADTVLAAVQKMGEVAQPAASKVA